MPCHTAEALTLVESPGAHHLPRLARFPLLITIQSPTFPQHCPHCPSPSQTQPNPPVLPVALGSGLRTLAASQPGAPPLPAHGLPSASLGPSLPCCLSVTEPSVLLHRLDLPPRVTTGKTRDEPGVSTGPTGGRLSARSLSSPMDWFRTIRQHRASGLPGWRS